MYQVGPSKEPLLNPKTSMRGQHFRCTGHILHASIVSMESKRYHYSTSPAQAQTSDRGRWTDLTPLSDQSITINANLRARCARPSVRGFAEGGGSSAAATQSMSLIYGTLEMSSSKPPDKPSRRPLGGTPARAAHVMRAKERARNAAPSGEPPVAAPVAKAKNLAPTKSL